MHDAVVAAIQRHRPRCGIDGDVLETSARAAAGVHDHPFGGLGDAGHVRVPHHDDRCIVRPGEIASGDHIGSPLAAKAPIFHLDVPVFQPLRERSHAHRAQATRAPRSQVCGEPRTTRHGVELMAVDHEHTDTVGAQRHLLLRPEHLARNLVRQRIQKRDRGAVECGVRRAFRQRAQQERLRAWVQRFTDLARQIAWMVRTQIKNAWFDRPSEAKGDMSHIDLAFYDATRGAFFHALHGFQQTLARADDAPSLPPEVAEQWYRTLKREGMALFEEQSLSGALEAVDLQRVTAARRQLQSFLAGRSKGSKAIRQFAETGGFALVAEPATTEEGVS